MNGLDVSFSAINEEWAACQRKRGWGLFIQNVWTGNRAPAAARANLETANTVGMVTAAYLNVHEWQRYPDGDTSGFPMIGPQAQALWHFERARAAVTDLAAGDTAVWDRLQFVAIDVETAPISIETVREVVKLVQNDGLRPVVYTGAWFWPQVEGNPCGLSDLPLWVADYDRIPDLAAFRRFGGWTEAVGKQYSGTSNLDGVDVDTNVFKDEFFG